ncbi:MAG: hypothetical protein J6A58_08120 [Oscillospiraceae bacterium]|nr:hypothetical protein [Oscillospiraceae bacterium]
MYKTGVQNLLTSIFDAKITGKGKVGNGKLYSMLMKILIDKESEDISADLNLLKKFGSLTETPDSRHRLDKALSRFLVTGTGYPDASFSFEKFEKCFDDFFKYRIYVSEIQRSLDKALDPDKIDRLTYTLVKILLDDNDIEKIFYGGKYISKKSLIGSAVHIKRICTSALLMFMLYYYHKCTRQDDTKRHRLLDMPSKVTFESVKYEDEDSFILEYEINIAKLLQKNSENICRMENEEISPEIFFENDMVCENKQITDLSGEENIFLYGTGGIGKTTTLLRNSQLLKENICFYFPLYRYREETIAAYDNINCRILIRILLRYIYQDEYPSFELCSNCEGAENVMKNLSLLLKLLKTPPENNKKKYVLLLDGINEMQPDYQDIFSNEISNICSQWKNVKIIISGRTVPSYKIFKNFKKVMLCPVSDKKISEILHRCDKSDQTNGKLSDILGIPLFLNIFLKNKDNENNISTGGELIDSYINNFDNDRNGNELMRFVVQFVLPFAAKEMNDGYFFEISRFELSEAANKAFETFVLNENIYQNFTAVRKFRKKNLLKSRERFDIVEYITENICLMKPTPGQPHILHFTHQFFKDYFAARHIINIFSAVDISYGYGFNEEKKEMIFSHNLEHIWAKYNDNDFFRMLGEITGDYKNRYCENFEYHRTFLDDILDFSRNFMSVHMAENIMLTMKASRGEIICGADFSEMSLPIYFPEDVKFSADGMYPCVFRNCWVFNIRNYEKSHNCFVNCDFSFSTFFDDECREFIIEDKAVVTPEE